MTNALLLLTALLTAPTSASDSSGIFRIVPLAGGVYAAELLDQPTAYAFSNSLIVIGRDGVLIVDTQQSTIAAKDLIAQVRKLTPLPVRWVVNTHWHGDHVHGNSAYRAAFPEVSFIGHQTLAADLDSITRPRLERELASVPAAIEARRRWLATGLGPDSVPLTPEQRGSVERGVRLRAEYLDDLRQLTLIAPDRTFERELVLDLGGRSVRLLHFGIAHTRGDVVVHLPGERILLASDLVEAELPFLGDGFLPQWAAAVDSLDALDFTTLVPSHGPVQHDRTLIREARTLLRGIVEHACTVKRAGGTPESAAATLAQDPGIRQLGDRYGRPAAPLQQYLTTAVRRAWPQLAGCG